jgi:hypothetical protein
MESISIISNTETSKLDATPKPKRISIHSSTGSNNIIKKYDYFSIHLDNDIHCIIGKVS